MNFGIAGGVGLSWNKPHTDTEGQQLRSVPQWVGAVGCGGRCIEFGARSLVVWFPLYQLLGYLASYPCSDSLSYKGNYWENQMSTVFSKKLDIIKEMLVQICNKCWFSFRRFLSTLFLPAFFFPPLQVLKNFGQKISEVKQLVTWGIGNICTGLVASQRMALWLSLTDWGWLLQWWERGL